MALAENIIVRYRTDGHVRFEVPETLCDAPGCETLLAELRRVEGVYRVDLYVKQRKLSIRFLDHVVSFPDLGRALYRLLAKLSTTEAPCCAHAQPARRSVWRRRFDELRPVRWLRERTQEARETATAMGILARRRLGRPGTPALIKESTVVEFLNDVLVLYLIKLHWHLITQHWLRQPWRFRYEWMAVFYLIYLLVRSRRPKS